MLTLEQKAWQLWENKCDPVANACIWDCSVEEAIQKMWEQKFGKGGKK